MALKWGFAQVDQQLYPPTNVKLRADAQRMFDEAATLRPKYWRLGASWALTAKQKEPGTFVAGTPPTTTGRDWSTLDYSLNEALLLGAEIVLIVGAHRPAWGGWWFGIGAVKGTATDFGPYCAEVATRYKPGGVGVRTDGKYAPNAGKGVTIFEIWNEENDQNHWGEQISAKDYTAYLKNGYQAIKAVPGLEGSASTVLFGGTYHTQRVGLNGGYIGYGSASLPEVEFVAQCYKYGAKPYFDAMSVHVYPHLDDFGWNGSTKGPAPSTNSDNWRQMGEIRTLMVDQNDGAKKFWITEAGFPNSRVTEVQQNTYWQSMWTMFAGLSYVEVVLFYCVRDKGTDPKDTESTWGGLRYDFTKKPVWAWLQSLAQLDNPVLTPLPAVLTLVGSRPALGLTVRPSPAVLVLAAMQPAVTVTHNMLASPVPRALIIVGYAPTVTATAHKKITPAPATLTIIGYAPTLGSVITITPAAAALAYTGAAPTVLVSDHKSVAPTKASLAFTPSAPVVTVSDHKVVTPSPAVLTITMSAPEVTKTNNAIPVAWQKASAPSGTSLGFNPSINRSFAMTPDAAPGLCGVALAVLYASNSNHGTPVGTWGGVNMTQLALFTSGTVQVLMYGILAPPTTAQNAIIGMTGGSNAGREIVAMAEVYQNVGSFGPGAGVAAASQTIVSAVGEMVIAALASLNATPGTLTGGTTRGGPTLSGGGATLRGLFGDAAGASPDVTVAATNISRMALARLLPQQP